MEFSWTTPLYLPLTQPLDNGTTEGRTDWIKFESTSYPYENISGERAARCCWSIKLIGAFRTRVKYRIGATTKDPKISVFDHENMHVADDYQTFLDYKDHATSIAESGSCWNKSQAKCLADVINTEMKIYYFWVSTLKAKNLDCSSYNDCAGKPLANALVTDWGTRLKIALIKCARSAAP